MFKSLKRNFFPFIIAFSALSISASAAFYSVSGLSKLFAGAQLEVIIMAGSLEFGKLVIASLLYQYWDSINKWLRTYLTIAATVLVLITSMGIYGFLSAAYQETYQKLVVQQNQIEFLDNKAQFYETDVTRYDQELERISNNISTLSNARSQQIQVRDTSVVGGVRTTISTSELRLAQSRIEVEEGNRNAVQAKREVAADSLQTLKLKILEIQNEADTVGELGPLQYLSGLTGAPMDKIINILLLIIIFVFDPLAISMVIAANFAFDKANPKRPEDEETPYEPILTDEFHEEDFNDDDFPEPNEALSRAAERYYDDNYDDSGWTDGSTADQYAEPKPPADISIDKENAERWAQVADELAKGAVEDDLDDFRDLPWSNEDDDSEIQDFLEEMDKPGPWPEEYDKIHTVGGLSNDEESGFMDFQKKMDERDTEYDAYVDRQEPGSWLKNPPEEFDEDHALDQVLNDMVDDLEEDILMAETEAEIALAEADIALADEEIAAAEREIEVIDPEEVSNKFEVEDTAGNVNVYDENENTDRVSTFPNENNPTSVAAAVQSIVERVDTPHLPKEEATTQATTTQTPTTQATTTMAPPPSYDSFKKREAVEPINEDELFDAALRAKAEQDKKDFLRRNGK
jgi:hypothetical protein